VVLKVFQRVLASVTAHCRVTGPAVLEALRRSCAAHGVPASTLTDNGLVFTARFAGGIRGSACGAVLLTGLP